MDLSFYRLLTAQLNPQPDLSRVLQGDLLPEEWPVVLQVIDTFRKQVQSFRITDGQISVLCTSDVPNLYDRIAATELGTIIHLLGPRTIYNEQQKGYILQIEDFMTLKQYDEHLKVIREAEAKRMAELHDEWVEARNYEQFG